MKHLQKYLAELVGSFVLVFFACGIAGQICTKENGIAGMIGTALAFGLVIVAMAYSIGNVSGCHINPAGSFACLLNGKISFLDFLGYIIAQFGGAIGGAYALNAIVKDTNKLGLNSLYNGDIILSCVIEAILTCVFVLAVLGATSKKENSSVAGLAIGGALILVHLFGIPFTGTSVNPARAFAPALVSGNLKDVWVFMAAPMVGGIVAALIHLLFSGKED